MFSTQPLDTSGEVVAYSDYGPMGNCGKAITVEPGHVIALEDLSGRLNVTYYNDEQKTLKLLHVFKN